MFSFGFIFFSRPSQVYPEICYVTGYSKGSSSARRNSSSVDLQVISCHQRQPNPFLTLSSYWKMITPALWDLPKLAQNIADMILEKTPSKKDIRVLHASCGAGHLCYELMKLGFRVDMSDGAGHMISLAHKVGSAEYPEEYARMMAAGQAPMVSKWSELPAKVGRSYRRRRDDTEDSTLFLC